MKTKKVKRRTEEGKFYEVVEYRVENPEYGEQVNTIMQMAAKRAETDGAKTLPGVASALRKLFQPERRRKGKANTGDVPEDESPRWTSFWNAMKDILGDDYQNKTHKLLGVRSMNDWLAAGKSLDDAVRFVSTKAEKATPKKKESSIKPRDEWEKVTKAEVPDYAKLESLMLHLAGISPIEMYQELGGGSRNEMTTPAWEAFLILRDRFTTDYGEQPITE